MLISLDKIEAVAKAHGFKVKRYVSSYDENAFTQMEISEPSHNDGGYRAPTGEVYSTAQFIVHDKQTGYGYNSFFRGPWHRGYAQSNAFGLSQLMQHPAMAGVTFGE